MSEENDIINADDVLNKEKPKFIKYTHHGKEVSVREDLKGKHKDYCLCYDCHNFKPGEKDNCEKAEELYAYCIKNKMTTPVFSCPDFKKVGENNE